MYRWRSGFSGVAFEMGLVGAFLFGAFSIHAATRESELPVEASKLVRAMHSDQVANNARETHRKLMRLVYRSRTESIDGLIPALEEAAASGDYQLRQCASHLLVTHYEQQGVAVAEWASAVFPVLVEGLGDDRIDSGSVFSNGGDSFRFLYQLESHRPTELLWRQFREGDAQARYGAAIILAKYLQGTVQPDIAGELESHLRDALRGYSFFEAVGAFQALVQLGRANLENLLDGAEITDWQQAALLQCAASYLGVEWVAPEEMIRQWHERATLPVSPSHLSILALYLCPKALNLLEGEELPPMLPRLVRLSAGLQLPAERARWAGTWGWFWYMDAERMRTNEAAQWTILTNRRPGHIGRH